MNIYEIDETNEKYPKELLKLKKHPKKLYVAGNMEKLNNKSVAIVGSRNNTEYGKYYASKFSVALSKVGITVVSGLAIGIDSICHENAIKGKGSTIAVIGSGINNIYPEENIEIAKQIIENGGALISEYPPETAANLKNFPARNRIIAGLSKCVIVIEAKYRSGSSITATNAFKQNKKVFCIPGRIGDKTSVGTNNLIRRGATLITNINDILYELGEDTINIIEENKIDTSINMEKEYIQIYKLLEKMPMNKNEISRVLQMSISELNNKITIMEIEGYIETLPGNIIKIRE